MSESWYDIAQICLNGHVITSIYRSAPELRAKYCKECGEKTITHCANCNSPIRGKYNVPGVVSVGRKYNVPSYCYECGSPYPWTLEKVNAAKELAELLEDITDDEREQLKRSLDDLVKESPATVVATTRFKRIVSKAGPEIATSFKEILVDIVSETVKKSLWG